MTDRPRTRQELYERIRQSSKEEFILEEMIRLGFWPRQGHMPQDPTDEIRRQGEIQRELKDVRAENRHLYNEAALLKELRKRRLAESKRKQQETKERHKRERQERAEAWQEQKSKDIVYLGTGVSQGLNHRESNIELLAKNGLPNYGSAAQIAEAMGISIAELRFLAFSRKTSTVSHYKRFSIPKKTGGVRLISAPLPKLKTAQTWLLHNILNKITPNAHAHGFRASHSIVTNAQPHTGAAIIINFDLKDFFPSIDYKRVKGLFRSLGYSEAAATIFGLICSEPEVVELTLDNKTYFSATSVRFLPQGAPTSPAITNLICLRLDRRLVKLAECLNFTYTRYADDLTFSTKDAQDKQLGKLMKEVRNIVTHEGLEVNEAKTRILRRAQQQEVTGIVVNKKVNVCKKNLKRFRATLFQIDKDGPENKHWGNSPDVISAVRGFANFVYMVDPIKGRQFKKQIQEIIKKYDWQPNQRNRPAKTLPPPSTVISSSPTIEPTIEELPKDEPPKDKKPLNKWWKLW